MQQRQGFTLIEVMVALVIMAVAILGVQAAAGKMLHLLTTTTSREGAQQLAEDRIGLIRLDPDYPGMSKYVATETSLPGWPNFTRTTTIKQTRDSTSVGVTDYKQVTVKITSPALTNPVIRSITVGAP